VRIEQQVLGAMDHSRIELAVEDDRRNQFQQGLLLRWVTPHQELTVGLRLVPRLHEDTLLHVLQLLDLPQSDFYAKMKSIHRGVYTFSCGARSIVRGITAT
jgi:hypothetical protein